IVVGEHHESQVFDAVALDVREWEDDDLRLSAERRVGKLEKIVRLGCRDQAIPGLFQEAGGLLVAPRGVDGPRQLIASKPLSQSIDDTSYRLDGDAQSGQVSQEPL